MQLNRPTLSPYISIIFFIITSFKLPQHCPFSSVTTYRGSAGSIINTINNDIWHSCKDVRWGSNSILVFNSYIHYCSKQDFMLPLLNMVVFKLAMTSKDQGEASPSNLLPDLTSRNLNYRLTHFNFIPVVFILLQDPRSMKRGWWHCHWSLRKGKTQNKCAKSHLGSNCLFSYMYEEHKPLPNVLQWPSLFMLLSIL